MPKRVRFNKGNQTLHLERAEDGKVRKRLVLHTSYEELRVRG